MIKELMEWRRKRRIDKLRIRAAALDENAKALYDLLNSGCGNSWDAHAWISARKKSATAYAEINILKKKCSTSS